MKCKNCSIEITPWMLIRWFNSAFRFRCSQCKTVYKIKSPYLIPISISIALLIIIFVVGAFPLGEHFGTKLLIPYLIFAVAIWCASEYFGDKYLLRKGNLEEIEDNKPTITPALFYALAFCFLVFGFFILGIFPTTDIFLFLMVIFILFFEIVLIGMVFGIKSKVEKLMDKIKE